MKRPLAVFGAVILAVAVGALAFRLPRLALRPMHGDEANQAVKAETLLETGRYTYDPAEHHGPTLYYLTLPSMWLDLVRSAAETSEFTFRIVPVCFGVGLILLLLVVGDGLGRPAAVGAGILTAISPAMVFYSRYYIQETLLVFFTFGAIAAGWRYVRTRQVAWAFAAGACVGLMYATKETWVLAAAATAAGAALTVAWARWRDAAYLNWRAYVRFGPVLAAAVGAALAAGVFYSSFFTHPAGLWNSILAYRSYLDRAGGAGMHDQPWYAYLHILTYYHPAAGFTWTEGLIVGLAVVGIVAALRQGGAGVGDPSLVRFLAFYTVTLTVLYAVIPYKTPWCLLSFLHGMILLGGVGAVALVRWARVVPAQVVIGVVLAGLAGHLGWQAYRASFVLYADTRNPYVYAHTSTDALNLVRRVVDLASVSPDGPNTVIKVITPENYWPLPWYLRRFTRVGYWHEVPDNPDAPIIITSADVQPALDARLRGTYDKRSLFGLRPQVYLTVYVEERLWQAFLDSRRGVMTGPRGGGDRP